MTQTIAHSMDRELDKYIDRVIEKLSLDDLMDIANDYLRQQYFEMPVAEFLDCAELEGFNKIVPDSLVEANQDMTLFDFISMVEKMETD